MKVNRKPVQTRTSGTQNFFFAYPGSRLQGLAPGLIQIKPAGLQCGNISSSCHPGQGPGIQAAFTMVEVLMALGILIVAVTIVARLEFNALMRVLEDRDDLEHVFFVKKEQYLQSLKVHKEQKKKSQKIEDPEMKMTSQIAAIDPKSSLAPLKHRLFLIQSAATWKYDRVERSSSMTTLVIRHEQPKEKEKKS